MGIIRIIGGKWRGRPLKVIEHPTLRPTPNRIRETVFNWLQPFIMDSTCCDLFAGSGALGFEALSRGAKHVIFIEQDKAVVNALKKCATILNAENEVEIIGADACAWIGHTQLTQPFDILFLDPPFASPLLEKSLTLLAKSPLVGENTRIYIESSTLLTHTELPFGWQIVKQKVAGEVAYHLLCGQSSFYSG